VRVAGALNVCTSGYEDQVADWAMYSSSPLMCQSLDLKCLSFEGADA
jgi:hypothetical protein